ncbi:MAG: hypothetical protein GY830_06215 [Bacteroidetes bacterium]|nr:hypothetical protein [Bacteroidota bacterium]
MKLKYSAIIFGIVYLVSCNIKDKKNARKAFIIKHKEEKEELKEYYCHKVKIIKTVRKEFCLEYLKIKDTKILEYLSNILSRAPKTVINVSVNLPKNITDKICEFYIDKNDMLISIVPKTDKFLSNDRGFPKSFIIGKKKQKKDDKNKSKCKIIEEITSFNLKKVKNDEFGIWIGTLPPFLISLEKRRNRILPLNQNINDIKEFDNHKSLNLGNVI